MDRSAADPGWAQARVSHGNGTTVASRGRWLSRGTGHGTGRGEIRVQSAFPLRSAVLYVQVMLWERGSGPLVMRCWLVSAGCHRCCQPRSSGLGPYVRTVKTKSGATAVQVVYLSRRGLAISGRQLTHDLLRRVLLPRSHVDAGPSCPHAGRKTLKRPGSRHAACNGTTVSPGWIDINPPDPEGRIRINAAVTAELLGEALRVVFAVRPDDEVPAVRADPPSPGGKIPGQRSHIVV